MYNRQCEKCLLYGVVGCIEVYGGVYLGTHIGYRDVAVGHILWQVYLKILGTELYIFRETCHMNMSNTDITIPDITCDVICLWLTHSDSESFI